jgi:hypothetical protein
VPSSSGACSVNSAGLKSCNWISGVMRHDKKTNRMAKLFVTHYTLARRCTS